VRGSTSCDETPSWRCAHCLLGCQRL